MLVLIIGGFFIGWILRWYLIRRMRKFIREEVNAAIVGSAAAKLMK